MNKITNITIVLSFLGLWVSSIFTKDFEIILGFILIFSFGILHGSNDLQIINNLSINHKFGRFFSILIIYLLTIALSIFIFYLLPEVGLFLFILFSAYHFGEQHWESKGMEIKASVEHLLYLFYGLFILFLLFICNLKEVVEVVNSITSHVLSEKIIYASFILIAIGLIIIFFISIFKIKNNRKIILGELFYLLILGVIFKSSSLIWGFTIYFIFWHSIPSLYEQVVFIYGTSNKKNYLNYLKKAFPYWFVSLVGIRVVYILLREKQIFYAIFFSFIAAVTFPHAIVINKMFKQKKRNHK